MPDYLFTLPKHDVCHVVELGIAVHMGAINIDKIMLRALSALSTHWNVVLEKALFALFAE